MTKQTLKQFIELKEELNCIEIQITKLEQQIEKMQTMSGIIGIKETISDKICKLSNLVHTYYNLWDQVIDEQTQIETEIAKLHDPLERTLMRVKYLEGLTWEEVCVRIHHEWAQTHRIHAKALEKIKDDTQ